MDCNCGYRSYVNILFQERNKKISQSGDRTNQESNYTNDEIEVYMAHYSGYNSEELVKLYKIQVLFKEELYAIQKALRQRQIFP